MNLPTFTPEQSYWNDGYSVIGIDEVGRGCLAGPVTLGAVYIDKDKIDSNEWMMAQINDSKKLTAKKREQISDFIKARCRYATTHIDVEHINNLGIVESIYLGIAKLVDDMRKQCPDRKILLLVDGAHIPRLPYNNEVKRASVIGGDSKSISIAAASIVAKVTRDAYMVDLSQQFPGFFWHKNKGYGTKDHREAIQKHGLSPQHRTLFVRKILSHNM